MNMLSPRLCGSEDRSSVDPRGRPRRAITAQIRPRFARAVRMNFDLEARLRRLMLFRVVMVTTLLFIATYVEAVSETLREVNPLYFVIGATYALTVAYGLALRFLPRRTPQVYAQVAGDLLIITALVHVSGGVRTGFLLLYPLAVLSATMLVPKRGALTVAGLATVLYGGLLLAVRSGVLSPYGLRDVVDLPTRALLYSIFVLGVACATVALLGTYLAESLRHAGKQLQAAAVEVADLRELNQVIVDSIQSGLMTTDAEGRILYVNQFAEAILGRSPAGLRGSAVRAVLGSPLLGPAELAARAASRALARLELSYRHPDGRGARAGRFGDSPRDPGGFAERLPGRLPGSHRDPAPRAGGSHQGEAGGGGGDGGAARPRDPQPPGLDPGIGPGPDRGAGHRRGGGAAALHHLAGVEAPVGHPEPLPLPGPGARAPARPGGPAAGAGVGGDPAPQRRRGGTGPRGPLRDGRRPPRVPRRPGPDRPGLLEPGPKRARGDAGRRAAGGEPAPRRRGRRPDRAGPGPRHGTRRAAPPVRAASRRRTGWAAASAWPSSSRSSASTGATSPSAARRTRGRSSTSACPSSPGPSPHEGDPRVGRGADRGLPRGHRVGHLRGRVHGGPGLLPAGHPRVLVRAEGGPAARHRRGVMAAVEPVGGLRFAAAGRRQLPARLPSDVARPPAAARRPVQALRDRPLPLRGGRRRGARSAARGRLDGGRSRRRRLRPLGAPAFRAQPVPPLRGSRLAAVAAAGAGGAPEAARRHDRAVAGPGRGGADARRLGRHVPRRGDPRGGSHRVAPRARTRERHSSPWRAAGPSRPRSPWPWEPSSGCPRPSGPARAFAPCRTGAPTPTGPSTRPPWST